VLEGVPQALAERITNMLSIPTIGIAAGAACDGQILVTNDLLGFNADGIPPFVQPLANLGVEIGDAVQKYCAAVKGTTKVYKDVSNT
jgi:3-methyl-2-oxobutanoate hydroxymethyltransferase